MARHLHWIGALCGLLLTACISDLDQEQLHVGDVRSDCIVRAEMAELTTAPISLEFSDRSLWVFASVATGTETIQNATAFVSSIEDVCDGIELLKDQNGLRSILEPTVEEIARVADDRRLRLEPVGGFVSEGTGYLYYRKLIEGPGFFDVEVVGTGVCRASQEGALCVRLEPHIHEEEPTLLWLGETPRLGQSGFSEGEFGYTFGCQHVAAFNDHCRAARVPIDRVADPDAYEFSNEFDETGWTSASNNATVIFDASGGTTVQYNGFFKRYLAITPDIFEHDIRMRLSDQPGSGYRGSTRLFDAVSPKEWFIVGGRQHRALAKGNGKTIAVSYGTNPTGESFEMHLVAFEFADSFRELEELR